MVPHWQQSTAITIHSCWHIEAAVQPSDFLTVQNCFFAQTHMFLVSALSDGPDQADSLSTTYLSRVLYSSPAACSHLIRMGVLTVGHLIEDESFFFHTWPQHGNTFIGGGLKELPHHPLNHSAPLPHHQAQALLTVSYQI